jgi:hypothetical protein
MYIFICSAGRSGSTLLDILIGHHSKVTSLGEIAHFPKNLSLNTICGCGKPVLECEFWNSVIHELNYAGFDKNDPYSFQIGFHRASRVIDKKRQTSFYKIRRKFNVLFQYFLIGIGGKKLILPVYKRMISNMGSLFEAAMKCDNSNHIVDSSKDVLRAVIFYLFHHKETKIILLTRDGRGVLNSNLKHSDKSIKSILSWNRYYKKALFLINRFVANTDLITVKYEDLSRSFNETYSRIFSELELTKPAIDPNSIKPNHHILNGNDLRLKDSFSLRHDSDWENSLSEQNLAYFKFFGGKINKRLGYKEKK